jgi:uncharacterized membrane-anchored protein YitT (DUF2179 family)
MVNSFLKSVVRLVLGAAGKKLLGNHPSDYKYAKAVRQSKITVFGWLKDSGLILLGVFSAGFGLKGFLLPNNFIDGGAMGIALLLFETTGISLSLLVILVNVPFIFLGISQIGKEFSGKSVVAITLLALVLAMVDFPMITHDKLLIAAFGGFFLGLGIGLTIRGGAVIDGTEILAIFLGKKSGSTLGDIILIVNVIIFSIAALLLSVEIALYAMLTYMAASKTVDFVIEGVEEYIGVTIVSSHSDEIRAMIIEDLGRGVTIYSGKRGFGKRGDSLNQTEIVFTVITRLEIGKLQGEIKKIDPNAFIVMSSVKDTQGGMLKKRRHKH